MPIFSAGMVAFHAGIDGFTGSDTEDTIIPFNVVHLNIGGAYDPPTGVFTPTSSGLYLMSYDVLADGSTCGTSDVCVRLYVNGVILSNSCSEVYASGGAAVVLQLTANDSVWMAVNSGHSCLKLNDGGSFHNKFSGYLIYAQI